MATLLHRKRHTPSAVPERCDYLLNISKQTYYKQISGVRVLHLAWNGMVWVWYNTLFIILNRFNQYLRCLVFQDPENEESTSTYTDSLTNPKHNAFKRDDVRNIFPSVGAEKEIVPAAPNAEPPV